MHVLAVLAVSLWAGLSIAIPSSYIRVEQRNDDHHYQWEKRDKAALNAKMPIRIAISQRNLDKGHDFLMEVSDPASPNFAKHWTAKEVADVFAPSQDSIDAVSEWLASSGIGPDRHTVSPGKHWIKFDATIEEMEELVQAKYHVFGNAQTGESHIACDEYHVPHTVHQHIDFISPTVGMDGTLLKKELKRSSKSSGSFPHILGAPITIPQADALNPQSAACYKGLTPACLKTLYGIGNAPTSPQAGNQLGIFENGDIYDQPDLDMFWKSFTTIPQGTGPILESIDGGVAPESLAIQKQAMNGFESLLDFQIAFPIVYPQKVVLYQVDDPNLAGTTKGFGNTFLDALDASYCTFEGGDAPVDPKYPDKKPGGYGHPEQCGAYTPTNIISISYGFSEARLSRAYETRQCHEYMKLGLQGVSVVYASGDNGVTSREGCLGKNGERFAPGFPATCPYVTSVGATQVNQGASITDPESAAGFADESYYSGGGFSNYFAQPSYQTSAVSSFFQNHMPPYAEGIYNASGRGFPDVSAIGQNVVNVGAGVTFLENGTSCAAPLFASVVNLINDARLAAGKKPAGFLNPTLYANPGAFNDITSGGNPGCGTNGFSAVSGWDPVTGLGTPKFSSLMDAFMALP